MNAFAGFGISAFVGLVSFNIERTYWSFNFFLNGVYYPFKDQSTAVSVTGIYEISTNREGVDIRPGDHFTLEYGISQYLSERLEVGLSGYNTWQVTDDSGSDATNNGRDRMYGIGGQIAYWFVKDKFSVRPLPHSIWGQRPY